MKNILILGILLTTAKSVNAQIPSTKANIQSFIDSIGRSNDRILMSASMFPAVANGNNFEWKTNFWKNKKGRLLWVEHIIPDSISKVYFYCHEKLIFASELTYETEPGTNSRKRLFKNIYFNKSIIIEDSAPERNHHDAEYYIDESKRYLALSK